MKKKILVTLSVIACALLLVVGSVAATVAYLTDAKQVTNTFTVGNVAITLDEAPVDSTGKETTGDRGTANTYLFVPGGEYDKDPTIHVAANSEECYLFVKIVNNLESVESEVDGKSIADQMEANGWDEYAYGGAGVYVFESTIAKAGTVTDKVLFETVTIAETATNEMLNGIADKTIVITAYAIQTAGLTQDEAWDAVKSVTP